MEFRNENDSGNGAHAIPYFSDTVAAISTAYGTGGIGIVRVSGDRAFNIASDIFRGRKPFAQLKSHTVNYGRIADPATGEVLDEVLLLKMKAPGTFTREDVLEIHCHGGMAVQRRILELVLRRGARLAEPGEFTKRAFLNGRMDLAQAEAVIDLICSKTDESVRAAVGQLEGRLSEEIRRARKGLIELIAHIEASVDYPEHEIEEITGRRVCDRLQEIRKDLEKTLKGFEKGRILREGISAVIIGKPNVGKSSLLNLLTGKNRAIVTDIPGTTRDIIEEYISIRGVPVRVLDTAGIRETEDAVEKIGVERTKKAIETADLVLFMLDAGEGMNEEDLKILEKLKGKKVIILLNKIDLAENTPVPPGSDGFAVPPVLDGFSVIPVSATKDIGVEKLEERIEALFLQDELGVNNEVLVTNVRHKNLIDDAVRSIGDACASFGEGMPLDCMTVDIKEAAEHLGRITGESTDEDVISEIFSRFCIGK